MDKDQSKEPEVVENATEEMYDPMEAAIAAMEAVGSEVTPEGESQEEQGEKAEAEQETGEEEDVESGAEEKKAGKKEEVKDSRLQVIARQEERLREQAAELKQQMESFRKEQEQTLEKLKEFDELKGSRSVVGLLQKLGFKDLKDVAREIYLHELGDDAPQEMKMDSKTVKLEKRIEELEGLIKSQTKQLEEKEVKAYAEAKVREYRSGLDDYAVKMSAEEFPYLAKEAAHNREELVEEMWDVANVLYKQTGEIPTAQDVARELETSLKKEVERFKKIYAEKDRDEVVDNERTPVQKSPKSIGKKTSQKRSLKPDGPVDDDELLRRAELAMERTLT